MFKKQFALLFLCISCLFSAGCATEIKPATPNGKYSTQTRLSSLEYSLFMNKQLIVFSGIMETRMQAVFLSDKSNYSKEAELAQRSIDTMQDTRDEVETTYPSVGRDDDRKSVLSAMDTAIQDTQSYVDALENGEDVSGYKTIFQNDFNELTGLAELYYQ